MKILIAVIVVVLCAVCANAATNTWTGVRTFTLSVSNQPNGQAVRYAAHVPVTNIWLTVTSGEVWARPANFSARVGDSVTNAYTRIAQGDTLIMPAVDRTYFYVLTTNTANNTILVELK